MGHGLGRTTPGHRHRKRARRPTAARGRGDPSGRVAAAAEPESSMAALEGVCSISTSARSVLRASSAHALPVRDANSRATALAFEHLGGMAFIGSADIGYLSAALRLLAFHFSGTGNGRGGDRRGTEGCAARDRLRVFDDRTVWQRRSGVGGPLELSGPPRCPSQVPILV